MADAAKAVLDGVYVATDETKAQAWDDFYTAKTPEEFQARFDKLPLPKEAKAQLWDAKFGTAPAAEEPAPAAPAPSITPDQLNSRQRERFARYQKTYVDPLKGGGFEVPSPAEQVAQFEAVDPEGYALKPTMQDQFDAKRAARREAFRRPFEAVFGKGGGQPQFAGERRLSDHAGAGVPFDDRVSEEASAGVKRLLTNGPQLASRALEATLGPREGGIVPAAARLVDSATTPLNVGLMAATGGLGAVAPQVMRYLAPAVSGFFTAEAVKSLVGQVPEFADAVKRGDPAEIAGKFTELVGTGALAAVTGKHALGGVRDIMAGPPAAEPVGLPEAGPEARRAPEPQQTPGERLMEEFGKKRAAASQVFESAAERQQRLFREGIAQRRAAMGQQPVVETTLAPEEAPVEEAPVEETPPAAAPPEAPVEQPAAAPPSKTPILDEQIRLAREGNVESQERLRNLGVSWEAPAAEEPSEDIPTDGSLADAEDAFWLYEDSLRRNRERRAREEQDRERGYPREMPPQGERPIGPHDDALDYLDLLRDDELERRAAAGDEDAQYEIDRMAAEQRRAWAEEDAKKPKPIAEQPKSQFEQPDFREEIRKRQPSYVRGVDLAPGDVQEVAPEAPKPAEAAAIPAAAEKTKPVVYPVPPEARVDLLQDALGKRRGDAYAAAEKMATGTAGRAALEKMRAALTPSERSWVDANMAADPWNKKERAGYIKAVGFKLGNDFTRADNYVRAVRAADSGFGEDLGAMRQQMTPAQRRAVDAIPTPKGINAAAAPDAVKGTLEPESIKKPTPPAPVSEQPVERKPESTKSSKPVEHFEEPVPKEVEQIDPTDAKHYDANDGAPATKPAVGKKTIVKIPASDTEYPAQYEVRELGELQSSHDPHSFDKNPLYRFRNDRSYAGTERALVIERSSNAPVRGFDPGQLIADNVTAETGPTVGTENGTALGGNSRVMILKRVFKKGGELKDKYLARLKEDAAHYGIDPKELDRFKEPVLYRRLTGKDIHVQNAVTDLNKKSPAELGEDAQAVADGRRLSNRTLKDLIARLANQGDAQSMADALRGDGGKEVLANLIEDGIVGEQEGPKWVDPDDFLTAESKARIGRALVGRLFDDAIDLENTPPAMKKVLQRVAPQVLRVDGVEGWDITKDFRKALLLTEYARSQGLKVDLALKARNLGAEHKYSGREIQLANALQLGQLGAERVFKRYANDQLNSDKGDQPNMFGETDAEGSFKEVFGAPGTGELKAAPATEPAAPEGEIEKGVAEAQKAVDDAKKKATRKPKKGETASFLGLDQIGVLAPEIARDVRDAGLKAARAVMRQWDKVPVDFSGWSAANAPGKIKKGLALVGRAGFRSVGSRIENQGAPGAGKSLMNMLNRAGTLGEQTGADKLVRFMDVRPKDLSVEQRDKMGDLLEGRTEWKDEADPRVVEVAQRARELLDEVGMDVSGLGVKIYPKQGKPQPFAMMKDFMPHHLPPPHKIVGALRANMLRNMVRSGWSKTPEGAKASLEEYEAYIESGDRPAALLKTMVDKGVAKDEAEALKILMQTKDRVHRHGSLEYPREQGLPFYDPDPVNAVSYYLGSAMKRLAQIATFGQDSSNLNEEMLKIQLAGGDIKFVKKSVDAIVNGIRDESDDLSRLLAAVRAASVFKLSTTTGVANLAQSLNALLKTDFPSFAYGMRQSWPTVLGGNRKAALRYMRQSGATIDSLISEVAGSSAADYDSSLGELPSRWLRANGFAWSERQNRLVSVHTGAKWAERNLKWAMEGGKKGELAKRRLTAMGIDADVAVANKKLEPRDLLAAGKAISDATQFRGRPQDLSEILGNPYGRVAFQFRGYSYQQARFVRDEIKAGFKEGKVRGLRAFLILAALTPAAGVLINAARNLVTGNEKEYDSLMDRYFDAMAQAGSLSFITDTTDLAGGRGDRIFKLMSGPLGGQLQDLVNVTTDVTWSDLSAREREAAFVKYIATRFGSVTKRLYQNDAFEDWKDGDSVLPVWSLPFQEPAEKK